MEEHSKEIETLAIYIELCEKHTLLVETIWLAFKLKEKNPTWSIDKCFRQSVWDNLLSDAKRETSFDLQTTLKKLNEIKKQFNID